MRYLKRLKNAQIQFIIEHKEMCNKELAKKFKVRPNLIATQKSRMRKKGIEFPMNIIPKLESGIRKATKKKIKKESK